MIGVKIMSQLVVESSISEAEVHRQNLTGIKIQKMLFEFEI
jgi:hypothetical protein